MHCVPACVIPTGHIDCEMMGLHLQLTAWPPAAGGEGGESCCILSACLSVCPRPQSVTVRPPVRSAFQQRSLFLRGVVLPENCYIFHILMIRVSVIVSSCFYDKFILIYFIINDPIQFYSSISWWHHWKIIFFNLSIITSWILNEFKILPLSKERCTIQSSIVYFSYFLSFI